MKRRLSDIVFQAALTDAVLTSSQPLRKRRGQARQGNEATTLTPARSAQISTRTRRTSHLLDLPANTVELHSLLRLDTHGCQIRMFCDSGQRPGGDGRAQSSTRPPTRTRLTLVLEPAQSIFSPLPVMRPHRAEHRPELRGTRGTDADRRTAPAVPTGGHLTLDAADELQFSVV